MRTIAREHYPKSITGIGGDTGKKRKKGVEADNSLDLVDIDYSRRDEVETAKQAVREAYGKSFHGDIFRDRVRDTLEAMLRREISLQTGCVILWELRLNGALFIPAVFAGCASELEESGDDSFYRDRILRDVREFMRDFED